VRSGPGRTKGTVLPEPALAASPAPDVMPVPRLGQPSAPAFRRGPRQRGCAICYGGAGHHAAAVPALAGTGPLPPAVGAVQRRPRSRLGGPGPATAAPPRSLPVRPGPRRDRQRRARQRPAAHRPARPHREDRMAGQTTVRWPHSCGATAAGVSRAGSWDHGCDAARPQGAVRPTSDCATMNNRQREARSRCSRNPDFAHPVLMIIRN